MLQEKRIRELEAFSRSLHVPLRNWELLNMALTHTSYAHEAKSEPKPEHNERIEFLGDAVLSLIVGSYMYQKFPHLAEGQLTKLRAHLVCEASLYQYAREIHLGDVLLLGRGEALSGGRSRPSILADAFEALLGAIYLDCGIEAATEYLLGLMSGEIDYICRHGVSSDYKTRLQEYLQRDGDVLISYRLSGSSGPEHKKVFNSEVLLAGQVLGAGTGRTKKDAEQHAARDALAKLKANPDNCKGKKLAGP